MADAFLAHASLRSLSSAQTHHQATKPKTPPRPWLALSFQPTFSPSRDDAHRSSLGERRLHRTHRLFPTHRLFQSHSFFSLFSSPPLASSLVSKGGLCFHIHATSPQRKYQIGKTLAAHDANSFHALALLSSDALRTRTPGSLHLSLVNRLRLAFSSHTFSHSAHQPGPSSILVGEKSKPRPAPLLSCPTIFCMELANGWPACGFHSICRAAAGGGCASSHTHMHSFKTTTPSRTPKPPPLHWIVKKKSQRVDSLPRLETARCATGSTRGESKIS